MKYKHVVCGGTFDRLHAGHKKLLAACFEQGERVTVGITDRDMTQHKLYAQAIQSYGVRYKSVEKYAAKYNTHVTILKISDVYGSTLKDTSIDALFVTQDTLHGAHMINEKRIQIGMKPLSIIQIPLVPDEEGNTISSEKVRGGLISRKGLSYYKLLTSKTSLILPDSLKAELRSPLGHVVSTIQRISDTPIEKMKDTPQKGGCSLIISVGDIITHNLKKVGAIPSLSIIDGTTQRKALNRGKLQKIKQIDCQYAPNTKGTIQREAVVSFFNILKLGHIKATNQLFIEGEEDLLTLVAVLLSPLDSYVWYGQQEVGAVCVHVTEKIKRKVYNLIKQFN